MCFYILRTLKKIISGYMVPYKNIYFYNIICNLQNKIKNISITILIHIKQCIILSLTPKMFIHFTHQLKFVPVQNKLCLSKRWVVKSSECYDYCYRLNELLFVIYEQ